MLVTVSCTLSLDAMFLKGLREGGVPIKFSSWHTYQFAVTSSNLELLIQERSRSVKSIFAVQQVATKSLTRDNGATIFDSTTAGAGTLQSFQYRIGGRYFPAAPVECSPNGGVVSNGGAEAYLELTKALNILGDYRLSATCNTETWATQAGSLSTLLDQDYKTAIMYYHATSGAPVFSDPTLYESATNPGFTAGVPSQCFVMAINLETSNGDEVAGLNAEEQSDIALKVQYSATQGFGGALTMQMNVFVYYDAMIILRENNVIELVQ